MFKKSITLLSGSRENKSVQHGFIVDAWFLLKRRHPAPRLDIRTFARSHDSEVGNPHRLEPVQFAHKLGTVPSGSFGAQVHALQEIGANEIIGFVVAYEMRAFDLYKISGSTEQRQGQKYSRDQFVCIHHLLSPIYGVTCMKGEFLKCDISSRKDCRAVKRQENQLLFGQLRVTAGGEDNSRRGVGICFQHEV